MALELVNNSISFTLWKWLTLLTFCESFFTASGVSNFAHHFRALHLAVPIYGWAPYSSNEIQSKKTWYKLCDFTDCVPASQKKKLNQIMVIETLQNVSTTCDTVFHNFLYFLLFSIIFRSEKYPLQKCSMFILMKIKTETTFLIIS